MVVDDDCPEMTECLSITHLFSDDVHVVNKTATVSRQQFITSSTGEGLNVPKMMCNYDE